MKRYFILLLFSATAMILTAADALKPAGETVKLGNPGDFVIVIPADADMATRKSAELLAGYLANYTPQPPAILTDAADNLPTPFISIGNTAMAHAAGIPADMREQSYTLGVVDGNLYITGGTRGPIYGSIAFLEEDLGVRWYNYHDQPVIPAQTEFAVTPRSYQPDFEIREPLYLNAWTEIDQSLPPGSSVARDEAALPWLGFNRVQPVSFFEKVEPEYGGGLANPEFFIHTYAQMIPAEKYFATNPEFFPMRNGARFPSKISEGQLCYTNEQLAATIADILDAKIAVTPGSRVYSVSANDNVYDNCECPTCSALIATDGVPGAQLQLANRVAERLAVKYPEIKITTLAYVGSQKPPPNVDVSEHTVPFYAPIRQRGGAFMMLPWQDIPQIVEELTEWDRKSQNIYVWDYVDNGIGSVLPPPFWNLDAMESNWKFWQENGVNGVFLEGAELSRGSLGELKSWVYSKKLWNPSWNLDDLIAEFVDHYYADAASEMMRYIQIQRDAWRKFHANYQPGNAFVLTEAERLEMAEALDAALALADNDAIARKIKLEILSLISYDLQRAPGKKNVVQYEAALKRYDDIITEFGITRFGVTGDAQAMSANYHKRLDEVKTGSSLPLYCEDSIVLTKPQVWGAAWVDDPLAAGQKAYRQLGGEKGSWGLQWSVEDLLSLGANQQVFVARVRVRPDLVKAHQPEEEMFSLSLYKFGVEGVQGKSHNFGSATGDAYEWRYLFRVYLFSPAAEGYFFSNPGAGLTDGEGIFFEYLEFIPMEQFKDQALAESLPLITL